MNLQKKSPGNPFLKILDVSQLFVTDAHVKKKLVLHSSRALLGPPEQK